MTMIVFDYANIRSRMLGDDKPKPKKMQPSLGAAIYGVDPARPGSDRTIIHTRISKDEWRMMCKRLAEKYGA